MAKSGRGPQRTTKKDWLDKALERLVENGADSIKISTLAKNLDCARSSFYWYFKNLDDLLNHILEYWQRHNTYPIVEYAGLRSGTICEAVLRIFICWADETEFNARLDFAVREWSRHNPKIRQLIDQSDSLRTQAIEEMFIRHGYGSREAFVRARTLYHSQIGYYAIDPQEPFSVRIPWVAEYVYCFTGKHAAKSELDAYRQSMRAIDDGQA